jgi:adenylate cyclase
MWTLLIRVPQEEPAEKILIPGRNRIGRKEENEIAIADPSASRLHAEIFLDSQTDTAILKDLGSTNGTYVNRERVYDPVELKNKDIIRIGGTTMDVSRFVTGEPAENDIGARRYTRELVLESLDHHAVLMYEIAERLNVVFDKDTTLKMVSELMQKAMGADRCELILAEDFNRLGNMNFPTTIAEEAISQRSAVIVQDLRSSKYYERSESALLMQIRSALCVPMVADKDVLGLIYIIKYQSSTRPFSKSDLQLAVAISHQASLTLQRMHLLEKVREEQRMREFFERFVSPTEAQSLVRDYLDDGFLPGLMEREVTIMFADIANSTNLAERIGAQKFGDILNRYYWDVTDTIFSNGGLVKYLGDGIMAVFGMTGRTTQSLNREQQSMKAVNAALAILNHIEVTDFGEDLIIGIGMNTGKAMVGYVGTQERVEITAVGDVANTAFKLQAFARPNRLLVGPETAVSVAGKIPLSDLGLKELPGRSKSLRVYEILRK